MPWLQVQILLGPLSTPVLAAVHLSNSVTGTAIDQLPVQWQQSFCQLPGRYPMRLRDVSQSKTFWSSVEGRLEVAGILLLLLYLVAGVIYSGILPAVARFTDEQDYLNLSHNLLHGPGYSLDGAHLTASRPPGYAFFVAGIQASGGDFFDIRVAQFGLLVATIVLVCRLGSETKMFGGLLIVTGLVICYPVLFYTGATLYPQTLSGFLFMLAMVLTLAKLRGLALNLATGISFGALILTVPTFLFTLVVVLGVSRFLRIIRWRDVLLITFAASLMIGAWSARNAVCFHRFVPIAANSGMNFLEGNNERANPFEAASNSGMEAFYRQAEEQGLDEFQSDSFYRQTALAWIEAHPGKALILYLEKALNFFNVVNVYASHSQSEASASRQLVLAASYILLLGLLAWRLARVKRFPLLPREKLLLAVYVLTAFTSAIFFTRIRHRLPYDYLIIAVIAMYLSRRLEDWITSRQAPIAGRA
jgi:hypothetical protein